MTATTRRRALFLAAVLFFSLLQTVPTVRPVAEAAGTPDISASVGMPGETLHGAQTNVTITATNSTGPDGFNLSFRAVLPAGVSYVPGSITPDPQILTDIPTANETTLWFANVSDLPTTGSNSVSFRVSHDPSSYPVGSTFTIDGDAYVNDDERILPKIDPTDGSVFDDTGSDSGSDSTEIVPFLVEINEGSPEMELIRGLHDQQTTYTITVTQAPHAGQTGLVIEDWIPAGIEFLGCGDPIDSDNSTVGEEYPGSGPIVVPPVADCFEPSFIETTSTGLPAGLPPGVYTHVVWDNAALGGISIPANGTFDFSYAAAIPLRQNTETWTNGEPATFDLQQRNIDNNNGPFTTETSSEASWTSTAFGTATYVDDGGTYTDDGDWTVTSEDVAVHKSVSPGTSLIGTISTWTLTVRTSEYATTSANVVVDDLVPDGLCPGGTAGCAAGSPTPAYASASENADGTWNLRWNLGSLSANNVTVITYATEQLAFYQEDFDNDTPILATDSWSNDVDLSADVSSIGGGNFTVFDDTSAGQATDPTSISKSVSVLPAGGLITSCSDVTSWDTDDAGLYGPGDRVCWLITLDTPNIFGGFQQLTDFLPPGFTFESWTFGPGNTIDPGWIDYDDTGEGDGVLVWNFANNPTGDLTNPGSHFEVVISSLAGPPSTTFAGDLVENLLKQQGVNSFGEIYFLRDQAYAEWGEPEITIDKVEDAGITSVVAGDVVDFTITVTNDGNVDALDVEIWDVLPAGLGCSTVSNISAGGSCAANGSIGADVITWTVPTVAPNGGTASVTYDVTIPATVGPQETYTNETGVRQYERAVNTGAGARYPFVPENNIDPDQTGMNTDEALDDWTLTTPNIALSKSGTTSITESGNNGSSEATIGETVDFRVEVTIPAGTTVYSLGNGDAPELRDDIASAYIYQGDAEACGQFTNAPATCLPVADPADWDISFDAGNNRIVVSSETATFTVPSTGPDYHLVLTFSAVVDDDAAVDRGDQIDNRGRFRWRNSQSSSNLGRNSNRKRITVVEPNLAITKSNNDADGIVDAGQLLTWTLDIENVDASNVSAAHDLAISDTLPLGIDCSAVSGISDGGVCVPGLPRSSITWPSVATLAPDSSVTRTFIATMPSPIIADTSFTNDSQVIGSSIIGSPAGSRVGDTPTAPLGSGYFDQDDDTVTAPRSTITKSVNPTIETVGETLTYTLEVTVPGNVRQYDTTIIDELPAGIRTATSGYTVSTSCTQGGGPCSPDLVPVELLPNGRNVGWFLGDQVTVPGVSRTVTIVYEAIVEDIPSNVHGTDLVNTANLYGNRTNQIGAPPPQVPDTPVYDISGIEDSATVTVQEPRLTLVKEVFDGTGWVDARRALPNEALTYRLRISNDRPWPAYDVDVSDTIVIDSGDTMTVVDVSDGSGYVVVDGDPSDGTLGWFINGPLNQGSPITITYTLRVWDADASDEDVDDPEIVNTAAVDEYWAVATPDPLVHREYTGNSDSVEVELDLASIGDYVWYDIDGDGIQDAGEPPIPGVEVTVTYHGPDGILGNGDDEVHVVTTDAGGAYLVEDLPGGAYTVAVTDGVPAGMTESFDLDNGTSSPDGVWTGVLAQNDVKRDVDFGYTGTGSIGDLVWFNRNGNATQDVDEPGLAGVTGSVTFEGFDGVAGTADDVVYPITTASDGSYIVENLPAGGYVVSINAGSTPTGMAQNYDPDGTLDSAHAVNLGAGEDYLDADFGYAGDSSIGDRVWFDRNRDGVQDAGEPGLANVTVELTWPGPDGVSGTPDDVTFTDVTDVNGIYGFIGLNPGTYPVVIDDATLPAGVDNTYAEDGTPDDMTTVTLLLSTDHVTADFGYGGAGEIGDFVWWDLDADGVQDAGEPGVPNVPVTVLWHGPDGIAGNGDDVSYPTVTDADGMYLVEELPAGEFTVTVSGPITTAADNTFDYDGGGDSTSEVTLADSESNLDVDFGYAGTGSIGDYVWFDADGDGVQDADEAPLGGVSVTLTYYGLDGALGGGDDVVRTATTAPNGSYLFEDLPAGTYDVEVDPSTVPAGMAATFDRDGTPDDATQVSLAVGEDVLDADFGYAGDSSIGDRVWLDRNADGVQDAGEPGLAGVDVELVWPGEDGVLGTSDDVTFTDTTDADGTYGFVGLNPGDYPVTVVTATLPAGLTNTYAEDGTPDGTTSVTLPAATDHDTADFGYVGSGSIGDFVWWDWNRDGVQDAGEPGIPNVDVTVVWEGADGTLGTADDVAYPTVTDSAGAYLVDNLPAGDFSVTVSGPVTVAADNTGDPDGGGDSTSLVTLAPTEANLDQDFGYGGTGSIGDFLWYDINGDGVQDAGEPGLGGVLVTLAFYGLDGLPGGGDDVVFTTTTAPDGSYVFDDLPAGTFSVEVDTSTLPDGMTPTADRDGVLDNVTEVTLAPAEVVDDADFGYLGTGSIGDLVWWDLDRDGVADSGEPGWAGVDVTVTWFGVDGVLGTGDDAVVVATTDAAGAYLVTGLPAGDYRIDVDRSALPADVTSTFDPDGAADDQSELTLAGGEENLDHDFGYAGDGFIGDFVWLDVDGDGVQDPLEPGVVADVSVVWLGPDGVPGGGDDVAIDLVTDAGGVYGVGGLVGGAYDVVLDPGSLPAGTVPDSDVDGGDPAMSAVVLAPSEVREDVDFGIVGTASLSGTVWHDVSVDGIIDPTEAGVPDATVNVVWHGPLGDITIPVVSGPDGTWSLDDIPSGDYTVTLDNDTLPAAYVNTTPQIVDTTVPAGGSAVVDHGVVGGVIVGSVVWVDTNGNGVKDASEPGIPGVLVEFVHEGPACAVVQQAPFAGPCSTFTTTDADGNYLFTGQFPGPFTVRLDASTIPDDLIQTYSKDGVLNLETSGTVDELGAVLDVNFGFQEVQLPATGMDVGRFGTFGLILLLMGLVVVVAIPRRRSDEQA